MNPFALAATALTRVATLTSIIRTRGDDERRCEVHGGTLDEVKARAADTAEQFEKTAAALEAQL